MINGTLRELQIYLMGSKALLHILYPLHLCLDFGLFWPRKLEILAVSLSDIKTLIND